jgi:branched-subunit amino acid ABC-type transport system permease component
MLASILASGLAAGAIYALVGVTYNTMFSASRVMSFTAGQLAMLGGVFGSMFMLKLGMPIILGFLLTLIGCALIGVVTEFVAVRPVLKSLDQHLYVLSTLALALMIQQVAAIKWGTEPQPFPRLVGWGSGVFDEKFWLPVAACTITSNISIAARWWAARSWRLPRTTSPPARWVCPSAICASPATRSPGSSAVLPAFPAANCCWRSSPMARC